MATDFIPKELKLFIELTLNNAFAPLADYLQENGNYSLGERLANPNVDPHAKLNEILKFSCGVTLDLSPADNGTKRLQEQWFTEYWNHVNDGKVMASMSDLYHNFKALKKVSEHGNVEQKNLAQTLLASLRNDFDWPGKKNWLVSSTRINYAGNKSLDAEIIHHDDCSDLATRTLLEIPAYREAPLTDVIANKKGLLYLRVLLDTDDSGEEIIDTLQFVGNHNEMRVWTAASDGEYNRDSHPSWAAGFVDGVDLFRVSGGFIDGRGCSRGVFLNK